MNKLPLVLVILLNYLNTILNSFARINIYANRFEVGEFNNTEAVPKSFESHINKVNDFYSFIGKLTYVDSAEMLKERIAKYRNYNKYWILLIDSISAYEEIYNFHSQSRNSLSADISAFIVNSDKLRFINSNEIYDDMPIFQVENSLFQKLQNDYSIENESDNIFVVASYFRLDNVGQFGIGITISVINIAIMLLVYCIWKYLCTNVYPTQTNSIHSAFRSLVFLIILKDFILLYYIIQSGRDMTQTAVMDFYLLTIIYTLESVTKTFIWFMLIFIAFGWGVYRQYLNSAEIKKTIFIFILIYFIFCLDQILDSFFNSHLAFNLDFKEIKNILFLLMVVVLIYYLAYKSIKRLKWKLYEVSLLSLDYVPSLLLKIKMLRVHSYLCMVYYLMYVLVMILTKTVWFKYMNLNLLLVIMSSVSDIGFLLFMYLYRPRNFPEHFSVTFDFNDEDANREMRLIQVKFTAKDYFSNDVCSTVNNISGSGESQARKDLEIPVVVINPAFEHEVKHLAEKVAIGKRLK